jgi:CubicO group peptidase (beta-lactamase class C family)
MPLNILSNRLHQVMNKNKLCFSICTAICLMSLILPGCSSDSNSKTARAYTANSGIDECIEQIREEENIPGISIVIIQGDEIIYCQAYGVTNIDSKTPMTTDTLFDLASLSKSFTALATLLLEDSGLIDIDDPVQKYLPDFQIADPRGAQITVRHLLNQTSGIPGTFSEILIFNDSYEGMLASLENLRLSNDPGAVFQYADLNYCLLGAIIERVSETTYEEYMDTNIFTPLGMNHTTVDPEKAAELGKTDGHQPMYGEVVVRNVPSFKSARAAGWVMSCAEDMGKWLLINLNNGVLNGEQVIPADDIEELHTIAILYVDNGEEMGYGMGWSITCNTEPLYHFHCGDTPNFTSDMLLLPDYDTGIAVLVNGQVSNVSHSIATRAADILLGLDLESINVPWWAHWKALDTMATIILFSIIGLFILWIMYVWWLWSRFSSRKRCFFWSRAAGPLPPAWQIILYSTPIAVIIMIGTAGNVVLETLYGYNIFEALTLFRHGAPPGLYLSGILSIVIVLLWVCLLALVGLITRHTRTPN